jgi:hypothetical protein
MANRARLTSVLLLLFMCLPCNATAQNKLTVIVYDVRAHKFVHGVTVWILPLSVHNSQLGFTPSDPSYPINLDLKSTTDIEGRATFEVDELLQVVDRVNKELAELPRQLLTKHYEIGIIVLARGYQCSPGSESLHRILEAGVAEDIEARPCKSDVKPETFNAKPGEIVVFVSHAM